MKRFIASIALLCLSVSASANDSSSAIGLGGLELTKNEAVSMDSEDLYLSPDKVVVKYRFTNSSDRDVETLVTFPLPPIPNGIKGYLGDQAYPEWKDFAFSTLVEGKPVKFEKTVKVEVGGTDVGKRLQQLGWPIDYWSYQADGFSTKINELPAADKNKYVREGLLRWDKDKRYLSGNWQVATYITRKQLFPAGKTISVEHSYKPIVGGSVAGMLERSSRKESYFRGYAKSFCVDPAFLKAFDRKRYSGVKDADGNEPGSFYVETWLDYVLKSGANWKGPIKDFRLVVDKGRPDNLVSFCGESVKKIGPTQFEMRKSNFEPSKDISILIVRWAPID